MIFQNSKVHDIYIKLLFNKLVWNISFGCINWHSYATKLWILMRKFKIYAILTKYSTHLVGSGWNNFRRTRNVHRWCSKCGAADKASGHICMRSTGRLRCQCIILKLSDRCWRSVWNWRLKNIAYLLTMIKKSPFLILSNADKMLHFSPSCHYLCIAACSA